MSRSRHGFKARHVLFRADGVGWKGERRYDARTKRVHYENSTANLEPCAMNVKRPGHYAAPGCRGFKRWVELP